MRVDRRLTAQHEDRDGGRQRDHGLALGESLAPAGDGQQGDAGREADRHHPGHGEDPATTATAGGWTVSQERYPSFSRSWIGAIAKLWRTASARLSGFGNMGKTW